MSDISFSKRKIRTSKSEKEPTKHSYQFSKKQQDAKSKRLHTHVSRMYHHGSSDMSRLDKKKSNTKTLALVFVFLLLTLVFVASAASFYIFSGNVGSKFEEEKVHLTIHGPQTISTGQTVTYVIEYENTGNLLLDDAVILLTYPIGFVVKEVEPSIFDKESNQFDLQELASGKKGQIKVKGILVGEPGSQKNISAKLEFRPDTFSSSFQEYASLSTQMTESLLSLQITGPQQAIINQESIYSVTYQNTSGNDLENVRFTLKIPSSFKVKSVLPTPEQAYIFEIPILASETQHEITIKGMFEALDDKKDVLAGIHEFLVTVELKGDDDQYFIQTQQSFAAEILSEGPFVNVKVNGISNNSTIALGETLTVKMDFENKSAQEIKDAIVVANLDSVFLDWSSIADPLDGMISEKTITWTKDELPLLEQLSPGEGGSISFTINVKNYSSVSSLPKSQLEEGKIFIQGEIRALDDSVSYTSTPLTWGVNAQVTFDTQGRYYLSSGTAVGSGPIPPNIGQTTTYQITWKIDSTFHGIKAATVSTRIPVDATFVSSISTSTGSLNYDPQTRSVVWAITETLQENASYEAVFEVSVTPQLSHVGKTMVLIASSELIAVDNVTQGKIKKTFNAITTNLNTDQIASGNGIVQ